ncbi:VOC family protein [Streptomyces sp. NPDC058092]|uniref:VOC family protein n=1 Tax=Streptomyces sp. NPDC058092 TaxID=3346336 RepID=UPI0036E42BFE
MQGSAAVPVEVVHRAVPGLVGHTGYAKDLGRITRIRQLPQRNGDAVNGADAAYALTVNISAAEGRYGLTAHSADRRHKERSCMTGNESKGALASVRYIVDDVQAAIDFYTTHLDFTVLNAFPPAFADVVRGPLRLLLSGPPSSGAHATPADVACSGRNRIHLVVDDLEAERDRLQKAGVVFRSDIVSGPGGRQLLLADPAGNLVELFTPAIRR